MVEENELERSREEEDMNAGDTARRGIWALTHESLLLAAVVVCCTDLEVDDERPGCGDSRATADATTRFRLPTGIESPCRDTIAG